MSGLVFELAEAPMGAQSLMLQLGQQRTRSAELSPPSSAHHAVPPHYHKPNPPHGAAHLNRGLKLVQSPTDLQDWHAGEGACPSGSAEGHRGMVTALQEHVPRLVMSIGGMMQPQGDTHNDNHVDQRVVNILTSLPFFAIGAHMLRRHQTSEGKQYAASMIAVGAAATAYHSTSGRTRRLMRKLDYYSIAASSSFMLKALWPERRWVRHGLTASALVIPFKPFVLSTVHTLVMQGEFLRQAAVHKSVRPHLRRHAVATCLSGVAFAVEDMLLEKGFGHVHAIWHCLAAAGVVTSGALIEHKEQLRLNARVKQGVLLTCHDSALSLDSLGRTKK